jgi:hypothetical protein
LGDIQSVQVFGANFFIDPLQPTKPVSLEGWNLVIVNAEFNTPGKPGGRELETCYANFLKVIILLLFNPLERRSRPFMAWKVSIAGKFFEVEYANK